MSEFFWHHIIAHASEWISLFGILSGLGITTHSLRKETKARQLSNLLTLTQQQREIWEKIHDNPSLVRVLLTQVDLKTNPITRQETFFVNEVILHVLCWYRAINEHEVQALDGLERDIAEFFSLPIPKSIWNMKKSYFDTDFVNFVSNANNESLINTFEYDDR